jgi:AdoMet-dependent heme synthase
MDYGRQIVRAGLINRHPRLSNRLLASAQRRILSGFAGLAKRSDLDRPFARAARRLVGAFLYSLKVEVNSRCDQECRMCYIRDRGAELSWPAIRGLFGRLRGRGVRLEILGGEPLLRGDICEIVALAKRECRSPFVSLYTTAVHADHELARELKKAGLDAAIVSLMSGRPEVHDDLAGRRGSFAGAVAGMARLREAGIAVYSFTAVHAGNCRDVAAIDDYVRKDLKCRPIFYQYIPQRPGDPLLMDNEEWRRIRHWALAEKNPGHMGFVRHFYMLTGNACSGGNFVLTVKADGSVQPCPFVSDLPLGNVHESDIWAIYRQRCRQPNYIEFKTPPAECAPCSYLSVCGGGCRAGNRLLLGSYGRRDLRCTGPFRGKIEKERITDFVPCFF